MLRKKKKDIKEEDKPGLFKRINLKIKDWIQFLSYDIWRLNPENFSNKKNIFHNILKTIMLTVRNIQEQDLSASAQSLTYRTILSLVPVLAVLFAIARGFGFEKIIESQLFEYMGGHTETARMVIDFINNSLQHAQGGVFAGIGIVVLLYTIILLFTDIENNFNRIWQVPSGRKIQRRITDYFALVLLIPIFMLLQSSLNIMISSSTLYFDKFSYILNPLVTQILNILPYFIMIVMLTLIYKYMPNAKVKFSNALIGGVVAGTAFQIFQMFYLSGQLWITKYNAIYGTFAAIPLLLLWLQLSWFIVLIGAELSYAAQNVNKFLFEKETRNISRRYRDFFVIMIMSTIVKRFAEGEKPLTANQISERCKTPLKLTNDIIDELQGMHFILPTPTQNDLRDMAYQPALDINLLTINTLMTRLDQKGSEDFLIDLNGEFAPHWEALVNTRMCMYETENDTLLKDL